MDKHLHIISFDVPYPADYGGVIDVYFKIKTLHEAGIKVHLHCYTKKEMEQPALGKICASVHYYPRKRNAVSFLLPYIVVSRNDKQLWENIKGDDYPILMEGIHCSMLLYENKLLQRKTFLRLHNVEYNYYSQLAKNEKSFLKKTFFSWQRRLLKTFEKKIAKKSINLALSDKDARIYKNEFKAPHVIIIPAFVAWQKPEAIEGKGMFCLYHGNLAINENENAALWLIEEVFSQMDMPLVIAGKSPGKRLEEKVYKHNNICLVSNPTEAELQDLIKKAQVNVLPSMNNTGVKLKLLNALFAGRHALVNEAAVEGSGLESICHLASDAMSFQHQVKLLYFMEYSHEDMEKRCILLNKLYNNKENAAKLIALLY
ncbi:MAG: glycosyltransferase [Ferruginibacter sp.]